MWRAGAVGSPVYMTASVAYDWAGAVMKKQLAKYRKSKWGTDRPTDRPTDLSTDTVTYRAASLMTKNGKYPFFSDCLVISY